MTTENSRSKTVLADLWGRTGNPVEALDYVTLTGHDPVYPSSFHVGLSSQVMVASAALAANELGAVRGVERQQIAVDMTHAASESLGWYTLDGRHPEYQHPITGLYQCADGFVRVHANLPHHRDGFLRLLGLSPETATRDDAEAKVRAWNAVELETALAENGLVGTALRTFEEWDNTPQAKAIAALPLFTIERIDDAPPLTLPSLGPDDRPLTGVRYLDLTRILAGPIAGRTAAAYGADVLLVNSPNLPNIEAIIDTSRGKLSAHADLTTEQGRADLQRTVQDAHVFVQGYRPGALESLGFGPEQVAAQRPGIVYVSLSAYGDNGPWSHRRGFDSLIQTAMGFNRAEQDAFGDTKPRVMPMQILDLSTGYLMAALTSVALRRQQLEGGSWHVRVSLAQTASWFRALGRVPNGDSIKNPDISPYMEDMDSGYGKLGAVRHSAVFSRTPAGWPRPSMPPGSHPMAWPD